MPHSAIVIGASSGIGRALARLLSRHGFTVGLCARRSALLRELQQELPNSSFVKELDVTRTGEAMARLDELIESMGDVELIVICAGVGFVNTALLWDQEKATIETNVLGFAAMANAAMKYFMRRRSGHLVNIASVAGIRGSRRAPAYSASKSFELNYTEGLRQKVRRLKLPITVTDVLPGFVDTPMTKQNERMFWVASAEEAARQIFVAIAKRKRCAFVTRRWRLVVWLGKAIPPSIYERL